MTDDDMQLVRDYAANQSEQAFEALVGRYVNLVYSTAIRQVRDPHLAEEITQAAFVILARKAGTLGVKTILPSWLHRTAVYVAADALKLQRRRERREQEAYMQSQFNEPEDEFWPQIAPLLDAAIAGLNEKDRHAVVLRFFQNKSLRETGAALGASEEAAKKRVNRALEKLRAFFFRHGVTSTTAIIAATISSNSVQAAPVALAQSVTAVGLAKGAAASTSTLTLVKGALKIMAWAQTKTAIVVGTALIVAAGTSVLVVKEAHGQKIIPPADSGYPQTLEALDASYVEPPAGENAATFELQGISAMQIADVQNTPNLPVMGNFPDPSLSIPVSGAMKSALAAFLQRNQDALQYFGQGAQYDQSRYPVYFTNYPAIPLPYLNGVKKGAQLEEMAAISDAANNDGQRAADDVLAGMGLARSLDAEPVLISQLVRAADVALSVSALEQVVNRTTLSSESLDKLSSAFQSMEAYDAKGEGFDRGIIGEYVFGRALFDNRDWLLQAYNTDQKMTEYINRTSDFKGEQDYMESTFEELMSARQKSFPDRLQDVEDILQEHAAEAGSRGLLLNADKWSGMKGATGREARCLANLRLAMTAIALEQYRKAQGNQYPTTLDELTPTYLTATPLDPYDGKALRYRKRSTGYIVYSVGPGLKDDGGKAMAGGRGNISFSVLRPPSY